MISKLYDFALSNESVADNPVYSLNKLKENFVIEDLRCGVWFIHDNNLDWLNFALVEWETETDDDTIVNFIFHGCGTSDTLREMRHIHWGDDGKGYTFYLNREAVKRSMVILDKYFD